MTSEVGNARLCPYPFRNIIVGRDPAAVVRAAVEDSNDPSIIEIGGQVLTIPARQLTTEISEVVIRIAREVSNSLSHFQQLTHCAARLHQLSRQPIHLQILVIANDQALILIEHAQ